MRTLNRLTIVTAVMLAAVMLAACASPIPVPSPADAVTPAPPTTGVTPAPRVDPASPSPTSAQEVAVNVRQERIVAGGSYLEGAYAFVEIRSADGRLVASVVSDRYATARDLCGRSCQAACPALTGPVDECRQTFELRSGRDSVIVIHRVVGQPCEIQVS
jgi:hypothetical protein